jgi:hypothetical protein
MPYFISLSGINLRRTECIIHISIALIVCTQRYEYTIHNNKTNIKRYINEDQGAYKAKSRHNILF